MKTFKDFLEWYNNLDVLPFIEAVEKMKQYLHKSLEDCGEVVSSAIKKANA